MDTQRMERVAAFADKLAARPEEFFTASAPLAESIKSELKRVFDVAASHAAAATTLGLGKEGSTALPLPELYVEGFDSEQIWGELSMQHSALLGSLGRKLRKISSLAERAAADEAAASAIAQNSEDDANDNEDVSGGDEDGDSDDDSNGGADSRAQRRMNANDDDGEGDDDDDEGASDEDDEASDEDEAGDDGSSAASDGMEAFLQEAEDKYGDSDGDDGEDGAGTDEEDEEDEDEDDGLDLSKPIPADDGSAGDDGKAAGGKKARLAALRLGGISGRDFFGAPEEDGASDGSDDDDGGSEGEDDGAQGGNDDEEEEDASDDDDEHEELDSRARRRMEANDDEGSDEDEEDEGEEEEEDSESGARAGKGRALIDDGDDEDFDGSDDEDGEGGVKLSRHGAEKARLASAIAALEAGALGPKDWTMGGEVAAGKRPANSLLSAIVEVEQAVKSAPQVTVEATAALEDVIRQRIADAAWDDRAPHAEAKEDKLAAAAASAGPLSTDKPAVGLGELYAREYEAGVLGARPADEAVAKAEAEAAGLLRALFAKLDALTNFAYTPKPPSGGDMAVRANVPAVAMEETLPTAVSSATARAPEEVYNARDAATAGGAGSEGLHGRDASVLRSVGEMTAEQRAAARRAGKASRKKERAAAAETSKREALSKGLDAAGGGLTKAAALEQIARAHNVSVGGGVAPLPTGAKATAAAAAPGGGKKRGREGGAGGAAASDNTAISGAAASAGASAGASHRTSTTFFAALQAEAQRKIAEATGGANGDAGSGSARPAKKARLTSSKAAAFRM